MARKTNHEAGFSIIEAIVILCILAAVVFAGWYIWNENRKNTKDKATVASFEECKKAGNPIQLSYPEVCVTKDGKRFTNPKQATSTFEGAEKENGEVVLKISQWGVEIPLDTAHADLVYSFHAFENSEAASFTFKRLQDKNMCKTDVGVSVTRQKTQNEPPFNIDNPQSFKKVGTYYYYIAYGGSPCFDAEKPEEVAAIKEVSGDKDIKQFVVDALKSLRVTDN